MTKSYSKSIVFLILVVALVGLSVFFGCAQEAFGSPKESSDYLIVNSNYELVEERVCSTIPEDEDFGLVDSIGSGLSLESAKKYRLEGLRLQQLGRIGEAITAYEKAIAAEPSYVVVYNDLAVVYEMKGWKDEAIELYHQALEVDSTYLPTYSNLAANYEEQGDLKRAAELWKMRIEFGSPDDPWTKKAQKRLESIALFEESVARELEQGKIVDLVKEIKEVKSKQPQSSVYTRLNKAEQYLKAAREELEAGDFTAALNNAAVAKHIDPTNAQVDIFIEEVEKKIANSFNR